MADVKWIKMATNIFDNRKIRQIECLPEGYAIIVVWMKLLCLAGNVNDSGFIYFTKEIPYTEQMLSAQFNMPITTLQLALRTFEQFGMVEVVDDILHISNWEKYQSVDRLNEIREYNRLAKQRSREKKKLLQNVNDMSMTSQSCHDTEVEQEVETEKDKDKRSSVVEEAKLPNHTHISLSVYQDLCNKYGKAFVDERVDRAYSDKALIRFCEEDYGKPSRKPKSSGFSNQRQYDFDELEKQLIGGKPKAEDDP